MGSPEFALPSLELLANNFHIAGVITQPDKPAGRGRKITSPPVKIMADQLNIPSIQPVNLRQPDAQGQIKTWNPHIIVVVAFGQILRSDILSIPESGCINIHASLLPRWRGAAPIPAAIINGDAQTGISIMLMDTGVDTGPILNQAAIEIDPDETTGDLSTRLAHLGAKLIIDTLPQYLNGSIKPIAQYDNLATYAPMIKKENALLNFKQPASKVEKIIRAYNPWPVAYTFIQGQRVNILKAKEIQIPNHVKLNAGTTTIIQNKPVIACGQDGLLLVQVQPAGKKIMDAMDYVRGVRGWDNGILAG